MVLLCFVQFLLVWIVDESLWELAKIYLISLQYLNQLTRCELRPTFKHVKLRRNGWRDLVLAELVMVGAWFCHRNRLVLHILLQCLLPIKTPGHSLWFVSESSLSLLLQSYLILSLVPFPSNWTLCFFFTFLNSAKTQQKHINLLHLNPLRRRLTGLQVAFSQSGCLCDGQHDSVFGRVNSRVVHPINLEECIPRPSRERITRLAGKSSIFWFFLIYK